MNGLYIYKVKMNDGNEHMVKADYHTYDRQRDVYEFYMDSTGMGDFGVGVRENEDIFEGAFVASKVIYIEKDLNRYRNEKT